MWYEYDTKRIFFVRYFDYEGPNGGCENLDLFTFEELKGMVEDEKRGGSVILEVSIPFPGNPKSEDDYICIYHKS